ncbi:MULTISPECIES: DUF2975 domain-containing protein [unclassified Sphingopyxis]|uniref:DUF2975 domain-containing protein n=1 Tax=unclassified Sphingopyxis TaxID=2614943 RepID=UPI00285B6E37|nr:MULTISPECIES: DUF2975 domain-containing protein [unclassified Sphingopyxis]MDR6834780.1 hypothetical protein [Sphingopyxis sp. BE122]MDR7227051.1 hypothetical protein [Sphingopyxis sp. BE259]
MLVGLNVLNWFFAAVFMVVLVAITLRPDLLADALTKVTPRMDADHVIDLFRLVLLLCVPIAFAAHAIFTRLVAMIDSVDSAAVFTPVNARRLRVIGWCLLATQVIDVGYGWISYQLVVASGEHFGWQPSLTAWLAVLMLFILARIFEQGAAMREEIEQTI